jgi:hypothetical protein
MVNPVLSLPSIQNPPVSLFRSAEHVPPFQPQPAEIAHLSHGEEYSPYAIRKEGGDYENLSAYFWVCPINYSAWLAIWRAVDLILLVSRSAKDNLRTLA